MEKTKQFSVSVTPKRMRELRRQAKAEGRSLSNFVNRCIDSALDADDPKATA